MQFISMREFTTSPKDTKKKLSINGELVVTNNGTPTMLVIDIVNKDFIKLLEYLRRQEALDILSQVQLSSVRSGRDTISMDDIDAEISAYRQEKGNKRHYPDEGFIYSPAEFLDSVFSPQEK